mgnify:FL=1
MSHSWPVIRVLFINMQKIIIVARLTVIIDKKRAFAVKSCRIFSYNKDFYIWHEIPF